MRDSAAEKICNRIRTSGSAKRTNGDADAARLGHRLLTKRLSGSPLADGQRWIPGQHPGDTIPLEKYARIPYTTLPYPPWSDAGPQPEYSGTNVVRLNAQRMRIVIFIVDLVIAFMVGALIALTLNLCHMR